MTTTMLSAAATRLLEDAAEWRVIAMLLERPTPRWHAGVAALASECGDPDLREIAGAAGDATEGEYLGVLGPGGVASPREIAHSITRDPGHVLAELAACYEAFAYRPVTEEPPDHASVEAGFIAYLRLKEAFAVTTGDEEAAAVSSEAARSFIDRHLSTLAQPLAERLAATSGGYLSRAASALVHRTGPRRADAEGGWTPQGLDEPLECGGCEGS